MMTLHFLGLLTSQSFALFYNKSIDYPNLFCANELHISNDKSEPIASGRRVGELVILDQTLTNKKACRDSGVYVDRYLTFSKHIEFVVEKLDRFFMA